RRRGGGCDSGRRPSSAPPGASRRCQRQLPDRHESAARHVWRPEHLLQALVRLLRVRSFLLRDHRGTIEPLATIVAVNALGFVFALALWANQFRRRYGRCRHAADSFFVLFDGADVGVFGILDSLPAEDFSLVAGASFFDASW